MGSLGGHAPGNDFRRTSIPGEAIVWCLHDVTEADSAMCGPRTRTNRVL